MYKFLKFKNLNKINRQECNTRQLKFMFMTQKAETPATLSRHQCLFNFISQTFNPCSLL